MKTFYVASYGKKDKKGIYIINFDEQAHTFALNKHLMTSDYPSYLVRKNDHLYVSYKNATNENTGGGFGIFEIDNNDLKEIECYTSQGRSYTHLCISDDGQYLFTANYHGGATASYLLKDNHVVKKIGSVHHHGLGPDLLKRQTSPHVHYVGFTPDKKYLYAVDLGTDKIVMYRYPDGKLIQDNEHTLTVLPGSGPRHMIFSQDGKFAYIINEISNCVMVYAYHDGFFTLIQVIHCVPRHFHDFSCAAGIRMTSTGKHLMVSNRGHDSIVLYRVNKETGKLSLLYMIHTGKNPRDFNIIDDQYVIVASQDSNEVELLLFNEEKEELVKTEVTIAIPAPVCVEV